MSVSLIESELALRSISCRDMSITFSALATKAKPWVEMFVFNQLTTAAEVCDVPFASGNADIALPFSFRSA